MVWYGIIGFTCFMFGILVGLMLNSNKLARIMEECIKCKEQYKRRKRDGIVEGVGI